MPLYISTPMLPPSPPPALPAIEVPPWVASTFAVGVGVGGLLLLFFGQRLLKAVLAMTAFTLAGGACGWLLLNHAATLPKYAAIGISVAIGAAGGLLAVLTQVVGLTVFAFIGGGILTALPLRLLLPGMDPVARVGAIGGGSVLASALVACAHYRCRPPDQDELDVTAPIAQLRRARLRAKAGRKLISSMVTSVLGAYGVVHAINQWWYEPPVRSLQVTALLDTSATLPSCGPAPCMALVFGAAALFLVGLVAQGVSICRTHRSRRDEMDAMSLTDSLTPSGSVPGRRGDASGLAACMR